MLGSRALALLPSFCMCMCFILPQASVAVFGATDDHWQKCEQRNQKMDKDGPFPSSRSGLGYEYATN